MKKSFLSNNVVLIVMMLLVLSLFLGFLSTQIVEAEDDVYYLYFYDGENALTDLTIEVAKGNVFPDVNTTKEGYTFIGWTSTVSDSYTASDVEVSAGYEITEEDVSNITEDITFYAVWGVPAEVVLDDSVYYILSSGTLVAIDDSYEGIYSFNPSKEISNQTVYYDETYVLPYYAINNCGFTFVGWYVYDSITKITGSSGESINACDFETLTVVPVFSVNTYTITYNLTFNGTTLEVEDDISNGDVVTVTWYDSITLPTAPTTEIEHYLFRGWNLYNNSTLLAEEVGAGETFTYSYLKNIIVKPVYEGETITFTYADTDGSTIEGTTTTTYGSSNVQLLIPNNKEDVEGVDYTFNGWTGTYTTTSNGIITDTITPDSTEVTLTASWVEASYTVSYYFYYNGYSAYVYYSSTDYYPVAYSVSAKFGGTVAILGTPTLDSNMPNYDTYTFVSWIIYTYDSETGTYIETEDTIASSGTLDFVYHTDIKLYPAFSGDWIDISYVDSDGETAIEGTITQVAYGLKTTLDVPTHADESVDSTTNKGEDMYAFAGWYIGDTQITNASGEMLAVWTYDTAQVLTASWQGLEYTISFSINDETVEMSDTSPVTVVYGSDYVIDKIPTKDNYVFDGWYYAGTPYYNNETITDGNGASLFPYKYTLNLVVTPTWKGVETTITFDILDGTEITANYNSAVQFPDTPEKEGYEFEGWYDKYGNKISLDENNICSQWGYIEDQLLTANFTACSYLVTYDTSNYSDITFNITSTEVTYGETANLGVPTKTGYAFLGWWYNGVQITDENGDLLKEWSYASDVEVQPSMRGAQYILTYLSKQDGEVFTDDTAVVIYDEDYTLMVPTREGYTFVGWFIQDYIQLTDTTGASVAPFGKGLVDGVEETYNPKNMNISAKWYIIDIVMTESYVSFENGKDDNQTVQLHAEIQLRKYEGATDYDEDLYGASTISWSSSDTTVATVDVNGLVTCVGYGKATITATADNGGKTAECVVGSAFLRVSEESDIFLIIKLNTANPVTILASSVTAVGTVADMAEQYYGYTKDAVVRNSKGVKITDLANETIGDNFLDNGMLYINLKYSVNLLTNDIVSFKTAYSTYEYSSTVEIIDIKTSSSNYVAGLIKVTSVDGIYIVPTNNIYNNFQMPSYDVNVSISLAEVSISTGTVVASISAVGGFSSDTSITIDKTSTSSSEVTVDASKEILCVYNISIVSKTSGESYKGQYTVTMLTPSEVSGKDGVMVVYINEEGETIYYQVTFDGKYMTFTVSDTGYISIIANYHESVLNLTWLIILLAFTDVFVAMIFVIVAVNYYDEEKKDKKKQAEKLNAVIAHPLLLLSASIVSGQVAGIVVLTFFLGIEIAGLIWLGSKLKEKKAMRASIEKLDSRRNKRKNNKATF